MLPDKLFLDLEDAVTLLDIEGSYRLLEQVDKAHGKGTTLTERRLLRSSFSQFCHSLSGFREFSRRQ